MRVFHLLQTGTEFAYKQAVLVLSRTHTVEEYISCLISNLLLKAWKGFVLKGQLNAVFYFGRTWTQNYQDEIDWVLFYENLFANLEPSLCLLYWISLKVHTPLQLCLSTIQAKLFLLSVPILPSLPFSSKALLVFDSWIFLELQEQ